MVIDYIDSTIQKYSFWLRKEYNTSHYSVANFIIHFSWASLFIINAHETPLLTLIFLLFIVPYTYFANYLPLKEAAKIHNTPNSVYYIEPNIKYYYYILMLGFSIPSIIFLIFSSINFLSIIFNLTMLIGFLTIGREGDKVDYDPNLKNLKVANEYS